MAFWREGKEICTLYIFGRQAGSFLRGLHKIWALEKGSGFNTIVIQAGLLIRSRGFWLIPVEEGLSRAAHLFVNYVKL